MYHRQIIDIHSLKLPVPINRGGECARFCGSKKIEASIFWLDLSRSWMLLEQRLFRSKGDSNSMVIDCSIAAVAVSLFTN